MKNLIKEPAPEWGGVWTHKKLEAFSKYVWSYLTIMKKHPYWKTLYFDGFAGSGNKKKNCKSDLYTQLSITLEEENLYKGSAERVLSIKDNCILIIIISLILMKTVLEKLKEDWNRFRKKKKTNFNIDRVTAINGYGNYQMQ